MPVIPPACRRTIFALLMSTLPLFAQTATRDLQPADPAALWATTNSQVEATTEGDQVVYRWHLQAGQSAALDIRDDHELLRQMRYYDYAGFEFRIASGSIGDANFDVLGHVSGARQYKIHNFQVAVRTTERGVWHQRYYELARPNWFPWDDPDGAGTDAFMHFTALALEPNTVIEIRGLHLARAVIRLKPDFETPITWPILSTNNNNDAIYTLTHHIQNMANRAVGITATVISTHTHFQPTITTGKLKSTTNTVTAENIKNGKTAAFTVTATMSAAAIAATPELYAEPLVIAFTVPDQPDVRVLWRGNLVRPLSPNVNRQIILQAAEVSEIRSHIQTDEALAKALGAPATLKKADEFVSKELIRIPGGHYHPGNSWIGDWRPGDRMPEAVNTKTGETQFDTKIASKTWKEYMNHTGGALNALAYAYLYTGDETYAKQAIKLFSLYGLQYQELSWASFFEPPWSDGPAILSSTRVALSSSYGSNWYFKSHALLLSAIADSPSWDEETRQQVYTGFVVPYATEIAKFAGGISNMTDITNTNLLLMGLAMRDATMVHYALYSDPGLGRRLYDITPDGFSSEGRPLNYHFAAMAEYLPAFVYLNNANLKADIPRENLLAAVRMPYQRATLTGLVPTTGDNGRGTYVAATPYADLLLSIFPDEDWLRTIGRGSTVPAKLAAWRDPANKATGDWKSLLETKPTLFADAGYAILRTGDTAEEQLMVTLDYGRNPMHAHLDRNTISLNAFGSLYTQGPGSLYNVGRGGMTRGEDKRIDSFGGHGSLGQNVVLVDQLDQEPAVGTLLAWQVTPEQQVVVAKVPGIRPGVDHTRAVVLVDGLVVLIDRVTSADSHTYDWVYHNFGEVALNDGWSGTALTEPLARTANYENLVDPQRLKGPGGNLLLTWTVDEKARLNLWQVVGGSSETYLATTGLNNQQTKVIPAPTPSLLHRQTGKTAVWLTVLEPWTEGPTVSRIEAVGDAGIRILRADQPALELSLDALIKAGIAD